MSEEKSEWVITGRVMRPWPETVVTPPALVPPGAIAVEHGRRWIFETLEIPACPNAPVASATVAPDAGASSVMARVRMWFLGR